MVYDGWLFATSQPVGWLVSRDDPAGCSLQPTNQHAGCSQPDIQLVGCLQPTNHPRSWLLASNFCFVFTRGLPYGPSPMHGVPLAKIHLIIPSPIPPPSHPPPPLSGGPPLQPTAVHVFCKQGGWVHGGLPTSWPAGKHPCRPRKTRS